MERQPARPIEHRVGAILARARDYAEYLKILEREIVIVNVTCRCRDCRHEILIRHGGVLDANRNRCAAIEIPNAMSLWRNDWRACPKYQAKEKKTNA